MTDTEYLCLLTAAMDARVEGDLLTAANLSRDAVNGREEQPSGWHQMALVSADLGCHAEALYCRERAAGLLSAQPVDQEQWQQAQQCFFGYATSLLLHGRWTDAWPWWEFGRLNYSWSLPPGTTRWTGQTDGDLLVVCEGGYGDLWLFSRFLSRLSQAIPGRVGLFVWPGCRTVRDWRSMGADEVYEIGQPVPAGQWRYSTSLLSLPGFLDVRTPEQVPNDRIERPIEPRARQTARIGFCWRSEERMTKRRIRSLTPREAESIASRLGNWGDVYSLSPAGKDLCGDAWHPEHRAFTEPLFLEYEPEQMSDWTKTIRYISGMTAVLTVDTAVAHLAGLLGVPTLCLLPVNSDWKWLLNRTDTIWYGPQFRLFRNTDPVRWETDRIVREFTERLCV